MAGPAVRTAMSRVVFLCFHPCLVSALLTGPSLLEVDLCRKFFTLCLMLLFGWLSANWRQITSACILAKLTKKCSSILH